MENKFLKYYSEKSLIQKLKRFAKKAGEKVVYAVMLLYYLMHDKKVGIKTKITIAAALGYFIFPADAILDLTPVIGFSDDLTILFATLYRVSKNVSPEIKLKARQKLSEWFSDPDINALLEIDSHLANQESKI